MILTNRKTFERECEKRGLFADGFADDIDRKLGETYGNDFFEIETGRRCKDGRVETATFEVVKQSTPIGWDGEGADEWSEATVRFIGF